MPGADPVRRLTVVDASVAVRWFVAEPGSAEASRLLDEPRVWIAPRLLVTEVASAFRRKVVVGELTVEEAQRNLRTIRRSVVDRTLSLADDEELVGEALAWSLALHHKLPDCLYLTLAESRGAALATADRALARLAGEQGIEVLAVPSAP